MLHRVQFVGGDAEMSLQMRNNICLQPCDMLCRSSYGNQLVCSRGNQCEGIFGCNPSFYGTGDAFANDYRMQWTVPARGSGSDSEPSRIRVRTMRNLHSNKINPGRTCSSNIAIKSRFDTMEREYDVLLPGSWPRSHFHGEGNDRLRADMERLAAISIEAMVTRNASILATFAIEAKHSLSQALVLSRTSLPYRAASAALVAMQDPLSQFICTGATQ